MGEVHVRVTLCFHIILFNHLSTYSLIYLFFLDLYVCLCYHHHPCVTFVLYHILPGAAFRATSAWPPRWGTKASVRCGEKGSDFFPTTKTTPVLVCLCLAFPYFLYLFPFLWFLFWCSCFLFLYLSSVLRKDLLILRALRVL